MTTEQALKDVQTEARVLLDEIAHKMALPVVRSIATIMRGVIRTITQGIFVNKEGVEQVSMSITSLPMCKING